MIMHCNTTPSTHFLKLFSYNPLFVYRLAYLRLAGLFCSYAGIYTFSMYLNTFYLLYV